MCVGKSRRLHKEMFFSTKKKNESVKQQKQVKEWNSNAVCDKVTFRKISTRAPLNEKVLS